jgi:SAM-dependent methyltransferase
MAQAQEVKQRVSERYGAIAERMLKLDQLSVVADASPSCCGPAETACCGGDDTTDVGHALSLYTPEQIRDLPPEVAQATLGCGNPHAIASLARGETVLDLGSGAGLDCFLAARQVGPEGHVIGLDMNDRMLEVARGNKQTVGLSNVEFRKREIEQMPVDDGTVDVIISNCVINLSPDKDAVFREAYRVLKSGGRFAVSDIVTRGPVPERFRHALELWAGCISGALDEDDYLGRLRAVGFRDVKVISRAEYGEADIADWVREHPEALDDFDLQAIAGASGKLASSQIWAVK